MQQMDFLIEDASGKILLEQVLPKMIGQKNEKYNWTIKSYKGKGSLPKDIINSKSVKHTALYNDLKAAIQARGRIQGFHALVVIADLDNDNYQDVMAKLNELLKNCVPTPKTTLFVLAIEEMEAWLLGDQQALLQAYPKAKQKIIKSYKQDSICNTWELLVDAILPNTPDAKKFPESGQYKCEAAQKIGSLMNIENNNSPSFKKFRDGLRQITKGT